MNYKFIYRKNYNLQVVGKNPNQTDRFYSAFYRKLLDTQIGTSNKRAMFLSLLFRVLRNDLNVLRFHAFIKRALSVSLHFPANYTCAILYTISQVLKFKKFSNKILTKSVETLELKNHTETVKNVVKAKAKKDSIILSNVVVEEPKDDVIVEDTKIKTECKATSYDPFTRNPLHSGANLSFHCELEALDKHFHPTVSLYANTIINGKVKIKCILILLDKSNITQFCMP